MKNMPVTKTLFQKALYVGLLVIVGVFVTFSVVSLDATHKVVAKIVHAEETVSETTSTPAPEDTSSQESIQSVDNEQHSDSDSESNKSSFSSFGNHNDNHDNDNYDNNHGHDDCDGKKGYKNDCGGHDDHNDLSVTLTATPQIIHPGESSSLSWDSKNTKYCSANWTTSVATSGTQTVSPTETHTYDITCTDKPGEKVSTSVTVTVVPNGSSCLAPTLTSALTAGGKVGVAFSYTLTATSTGSSTAITYAVGTSTLPAGTSFTPNTISGTPTVSGVFNVPLTATNQCGVDSKTLVITIAPADSGCTNPAPQSGWLGEYYDLPKNHPDVELPQNKWDKNYGDPLSSGSAWTTDWYASKYFKFSRGDANLNFGNNFFPFDATASSSEKTNGHDYYFGVHWKAQVSVPTAGNYEYTLTSDDDAWVYVNGALKVSNPGIHSAKTKTGTIFLSGTSTVDVFFAERNMVGSQMNFKFLSNAVVINQPQNGGQCPSNTAPVITLVGENPLTLTVGQAFVDPGATALDAEDGDITNKIVVSGTVGTTTGSYTLTYNVTDLGGLSATPVTRTVVVSAGNGGGNTTTATLTANPTSIAPNASSTLSWTSTNATSCVAPWTTATSTSGTASVAPAVTTTYSIVCSNGSQNATSSATVTVSTGGGGSNAPAVSLSAQPSTISNGGSSTLSWTSTNATSCVAPWTTATSTSGSELVSPTVTTDYSISCSNGSQSATSTATVTVSTGNGGGGGNGGGSTGGSSSGTGGRSGSRHTISGVPQILGAETSCTYLKDYLRIDWKNDPVEVIKLQVFLKSLEGFKSLNISGLFDQATFDAVSAFQTKYKADILTPWGHTQPTGFVYILTQKKVNEIFCDRAFPLSTAQEKEISDFKGFLGDLNANGVSIPGFSNGTSQGQAKGQILSTNTSVPVNFSGALAKTITVTGAKTATAKASSEVKNILRGGVFSNPEWRSVAAAIFAGPRDFKQSSRAVLGFLILLAIIYALTHFIVGRQNKDNKLTVESIRLRKIFFFVLGLLGAVLGSLIFKRYTLVLPLLTLVVIMSVVALWLSLKKKEVRTLVEVKKD